MKNYINFYMPDYIKKIIDGNVCSNCFEPIKSKNLFSFGLQQDLKSDALYVHIESKCDNCGRIVNLDIKNNDKSFNFTIENLCQSILEKSQIERALIDTIRRNEIEFTDFEQEEADKFVEKMNSIKYHQDFMKEIGCLDSEGNKK